jgi:HAMP domain-containing protein
MAKKATKKRSGLGLLPRLYLGVLIPILLAFMVIGSMVFFSWNIGGQEVTSLKDLGIQSLRDLSEVSTRESTASLNRLGEKIIREKAIDVAAQIEIFIKSNPKMKREDLVKDPWLKQVAVQKVGDTGYTAVHDTQGINHFHPNPQIVGTDLHQLAERLPAFWKILEASLKGPASGYYDWKDADGKIRPKFMYLASVKDTDLVVASTTYIEEFSRPAKGIQDRMKFIESQYLESFEMKIQVFYLIIAVTLVVLLIVIYYYSRSVIQPIHSLSVVADKISMGDLDARIGIKAKGEVGALAESIERMQTSVKAAIERLQKRREMK